METKPNKTVSEEEMTFFVDQYKIRQEFIKAAKEVCKPIYELLSVWEELSHEDNGKTSDCPFDKSFDEFCADYTDWVWKMDEKFSPKIDKFEPTITVKDMKQILAVLEDDVQIVISDQKNDWWINIKEVELPSEGVFTLVFHPTDDFDNRQF